METDASKCLNPDTVLQITEDLTKVETQHFKFLCSDHIAIGNLENMDATELMMKLKERKVYTMQNVDFLAECLILIGRLDILELLKYKCDAIDKFRQNLKEYSSAGGLSRFRILVFYLADNLTKEEVKKAVMLLQGRVTFPKGNQDKCKTGFDLMNILIKAHYAHPDKIDDLIRLAQRLNRMDLKEKITLYKVNKQESNDVNNEIKQERNGAKFDAKQESNNMNYGIKQENKDKKSEMKQESSYKKCDGQEQFEHRPPNWTELIERIPPEKHHSFFEDLNISKDKYRMCKDNLDELLSYYYKEKFQLSDLQEALKKLDLNETSYPEPENNLEKYTMTSRPRGICLIINNENFKRLPREGSSFDRDALKKLFESFHFEIIMDEDLTKQEMSELLWEVASQDHSQYDCFVCCILSHGQDNKVMGIDHESLTYQKLKAPFRPDKCKSLSGKPKLFFVQACQGEDYQVGVQETQEIVSQEGSDSLQTDVAPLIPNEADFLMAHSTVSGYVSVRSKTRGSWFIQDLCKVFSENARKFDLSDMLLMVNNHVSQRVGTVKYSQVVQIPAPLSTLRKKVFFLSD